MTVHKRATKENPERESGNRSATMEVAPISDAIIVKRRVI